MLIVRFHNTGTGTNESANYTAEVRINDRIIYMCTIQGHDRTKGWCHLLRQLATCGEEFDHIRPEESITT